MLRSAASRIQRHVGNTVSKAFSAKYLLITNGLVSAVMSGSADSLVQKICKRHGTGKSSAAESPCNKMANRSLDVERVFRMTVTGLSLGVIAHYWYVFLDSRYSGTTVRIVVKKMLIDQLFFSPVGICTFFGVLALLEGSSLHAFKSDLFKKGPELMVVDWLVYLPAQFINFKFLPTRFRVLYDCCIAFLLDIYYSHLKYER